MCKLTLKQQHGERDRWREEFLSSKQARHPQGISYFKAQTEISLNRIKGHFPKGRTGTPSFLAGGNGLAGQNCEIPSSKDSWYNSFQIQIHPPRKMQTQGAQNAGVCSRAQNCCLWLVRFPLEPVDLCWKGLVEAGTLQNQLCRALGSLLAFKQCHFSEIPNKTQKGILLPILNSSSTALASVDTQWSYYPSVCILIEGDNH